MEKYSPRAVFFNVPGHGHVDPSLPLVKELTGRGHRIDYFVTEGYRDKVEAAGAVYRPTPGIDDDYFAIRGMDGSRPMALLLELITTTKRIMPDLLSELRTLDPDYILFDCMCPWGCYAGRILKLPSVSSISLMPPIRPPLKVLFRPDYLRLIGVVLNKDFGKAIRAGRLSRAFGAEYGVRPLGPISLMNAPGDLSIAYTSREFQPFAETAPDSVRFVGRDEPDNPGPLPALFDRLNGRPLVYVSLGSVINRNKDFFRMIVEAFAGRREAVLISTGNGVDPAEFGELPDNVAIEAWVPQSQVLKRASLFITHGGLNSVHDGLLFGLPMLFVPQQEEQTLNGGRAVELGAGLMLRRKEVSPERILSMAERLLAEPAFKENACRLGETLRTAGGVKTAADEIELIAQASRARYNSSGP